MPFNPEKLKKIQERAAAGSSRTGGKGSVRRKKKVPHKAATHDDKRLKSQLNRLNVRDIPAIEEVNLFKDDGTVIHFANPKVQASIPANTYVVSGNAETKSLQDLLPGIITQLGPDNIQDLKKLYSQFAERGGMAAGGDDDDDVPKLVENFEEASKKKPGSGDSKADIAPIEEEDDEDVPDLVDG